MACGPRSRWWLPPLASLALAALWFVGQVFLGVVFSLGGVPAFIDEASREMVVTLALIGVLLPAVFFIAARAWRRRGGEISSVAGRIRWRWLLLCAAVAVPFVALGNVLVIALITIAYPPTPDLPAEPAGPAPAMAVTVAVLLVLLPRQAAAEEYLTRGWIVQAFGAYQRTPWVGVGVGAVVFVLLHGQSTVTGYAGLLTFGLVLGRLVVRTGGLEAGIAFHIIWNAPDLVVGALVGDADAESNLGDTDWPVLMTVLIVMPLYVFVVARLASRRRLGAT